MRKSISILSIFFCLILFFVVSNSVSAQTSGEAPLSNPRLLQNIQDRIQRAEDRAEDLKVKREERATRAADRVANRQARLSEARLRICESRSSKIQNRVNNVLQHGGRLNLGHAKIQERVDGFYQERLVANGYVLENYDELVEAMNAEKINVENILDLAGESGPQIDCSSDDPMGQINIFKDDLQELIDANKAYRVAVHEFVKAVLDLAKEARADSEDGTSTEEVVDEEGGVE